MKGREKLHSFLPSYKTTEISRLETKFALTPSTANECLGSRIKKTFLTNVWINVLNMFVWTPYDTIFNQKAIGCFFPPGKPGLFLAKALFPE